MSGGEYGYLENRIEETYCNRMHDLELDMMMKDLIPLLRELDLWKSCDTNEKQYRKIVMQFKDKWFKGSRDKILEEIIEEESDKLKKKLYSVIYGTESEDIDYD